MKPIRYLTLLAILICPVWLVAGLEKDPAAGVDLSPRVETALSGLKMSGYVDAGYIYNFTGSSRLNFPGYANDGTASGDFNLNAVKMTLEKCLCEGNTLQAGFRVDVMTGEDAAGFTGNGSGSNSIYFQQAYAVVRLPWGDCLDVKFGKWSSLLGYEGDERPSNLNITQGINAVHDPGPETGLLLSYPVAKQVKLMLAVVNGAGLDTNPGLETSSDGYAETGAVSTKTTDDSFEGQLSFHYAPAGDGGLGQTADSAILGLNGWGSWKPKFAGDKLLLAVNGTAWFARNAGPVGVGGQDGSAFYTGAFYVKYFFCNCVSLAGRAEYAHTDDTNFLTMQGKGSDDFWSWTLTPAWDLAQNWMLRLEYRFRLGDEVTSNAGKSAHGAGAELVYTF